MPSSTTMLLPHQQHLSGFRWEPKGTRQIQTPASSSVWAFGSFPLVPYPEHSFPPYYLHSHMLTLSLKCFPYETHLPLNDQSPTPHPVPKQWLSPYNSCVFLIKLQKDFFRHCGETLTASDLHSFHLRPETVVSFDGLFPPGPLPWMLPSSAASPSSLLLQHQDGGTGQDLEGKMSPSYHPLFFPQS